MNGAPDGALFVYRLVGVCIRSLRTRFIIRFCAPLMGMMRVCFSPLSFEKVMTMNKLFVAAVLAFFSCISSVWAIDVGTSNPQSGFDMKAVLGGFDCEFGNEEATDLDTCVDQIVIEATQLVNMVKSAEPREELAIYSSVLYAVHGFSGEYAAWFDRMYAAGEFDTANPETTGKLNDIEVIRRKAEEALVGRFWVVMNHAKQ